MSELYSNQELEKGIKTRVPPLQLGRACDILVLFQTFVKQNLYILFTVNHFYFTKMNFHLKTLQLEIHGSGLNTKTLQLENSIGTIMGRD